MTPLSLLLVVPSLLIRFILLAEMDIPSPPPAAVEPSLLLLSSSNPSIVIIIGIGLISTASSWLVIIGDA